MELRRRKEDGRLPVIEDNGGSDSFYGENDFKKWIEKMISKFGFKISFEKLIWKSELENGYIILDNIYSYTLFPALGGRRA